MQRFKFGVFAVAPVVLLLAAGACAPPPAAGPSAEIEAAAEAWEAALNEKDVEALVALYTEDTRLMPPNGEVGQGAEAVRKEFGGMIEAGMSVKLETVEAVAVADLGHRVGTYTLEISGEQVDHGKYIETWRKEADGWRISNDIWNSDVALPAPGKATLSVVHEVKDAAKWLAAWRGEKSRKVEFAKYGVADARIFQSRDNPNLTGVVVELSDPAAFEQFMASPEAAAAKAADGVLDKSMRILVEVKE